jgi:6-phosphofructokinase 1
MAFIEEHHEQISKHPPHKPRHAGPNSASVITIQSGCVQMVPVQDMVKHADMVNRRGKTPWWAGITDLVGQLAGKPQFLGLKGTDLSAKTEIAV